ncbi:MAG TPA: hypothetical protein DCX89_07335, partial [Saprospirales bacterium]|nr:hypothetical protein [Saprospirales bacterium]
MGQKYKNKRIILMKRLIVHFSVRFAGILGTIDNKFAVEILVLIPVIKHWLKTLRTHILDSSLKSIKF